ncbi:hypothetical protein BBK36DRAFT_1182688 [Trichoderma citrinoviride]|uniref:Uncharacterized protein n=1 Tax=Trichoderma citrinoviride TaxID=58853 RepID=A0A2T4B155_9HYPO|nr:hypothetical protein BBK36DRAFT_1182688 [Trichoderma citrinoviride]PTB63053.1 hypothetical protein BBK36DRAFT_1182688 [Trichoderma citrinoviride]
MAAAYLDYEVHSNFINVGAGDGCIHFLMNKKTIERAVLIDGGDDEAEQPTRESFEALRKIYKGKFKLDAIVITHWDGDHYRSLTSVLYDDFVKHKEKSTLIDENAVFYCPWTAMNKMNKNTKWRVEDDTLYFVVGTTWHPICAAVTSTNCIGYDLFTNKPIYDEPSKDWTSVASLTDVYKLPTLKKLLKPIFLIVGIDNQFIDDDPWVPPVKAWKTVGKGARVINGASLMATVIWPSAIGEYRVSLYTGGDAEEGCERCLLEWMEKGRNLLKREVRLDVVKMGHHGSHFALPESIVKFQNKAFVVSAGSRHGHPSYSVLFYLLGIADMMKNNDPMKISPFHIYGTRKPYWMDIDASELSRVHFNVNTILSYTGGTAVVWKSMLEVLKFTKNGSGNLTQLRKELNDLLQNSVGESMRHMKNLFWIEKGGDLSGLATVADGDTILNQFENWTPPSKHTLLNPTREYATAVKHARQRMQQKWAEHGCEPNSDPSNIRFVAVKANSSNVVCKIVKQGANAIWEDIVQTSARSGNSFAGQASDPHRFGGKRKAQKKNNLLISVSATAGPDDEIEEWTHGLLFDDIKKAQDQPGSNFPKTGRFVRHHLLGNASDVALWLNQCFSDAVAFKVGGSIEEDGKIVLDMMDILISPTFHSTGTPSSEPIRLAFTTEQHTRNAQFGEAATSLPQTALGFDRRLQGFLFALDNSQTTGNMTLAQFSELIDFPLPPLVKGILSMVKLRPAPARSFSGTKIYEGPDCRSGIWFMPCHDLRVIFRMAMELDHGESLEVSTSESTSAMEKLLEGSGLASTVSDVIITGTSVSEALLNEYKRTRSVLGLQAKLTINTSKQDSASTNPFGGFSVAAGITFTNSGFEVKLVMHDKTSDILSSLLQWCQNLISQESVDQNATSLFETSTDDIVSSVKDAFGTIFKHFNIRSVIIGFEGESDDGTSSSSGMPKPSYFTINIETTLLQNDKVPFLTSLSWSQGVYSLSCELWHDSSTFDIAGTPLSIQPYSDLGNMSAINPMTRGSVGSLSIKDLIGKPDMVFPAGIPSVISDARLNMSFGGTRKTVFLEGAVECPPISPERGSLPPVFRFSQLHVALKLAFASGGTEFDLAFEAVTEVRLPKGFTPDDSHGVVDDVIAIETRVEYNREHSDSSWTISGKVKNLKMAHLYDLFAADGSNDAIRDLMGGIHLDYVFLSYEYHKNLPGRFELDGVLVLGSPNNGLELKLEYTHIGKAKNGEEQEDSSWFFRAGAMAAMDKEGPTPEEKTFKIAALLEGLVDDVDDLPEVVHSMEIPLSALEANLACSRVPGAKKGENHAVSALTFTLTTQSGKFAVTLAQVRSYGGSKDKDTSKVVPARLLRFSLSNMNSIQVPVVGGTTPPFDQVGVVWTNRDISPAEIAVLNEHVFTNEPLLVKTPSGDTGPDASDKGLLQKGFHFQVALLEGSQPKLILDHVVGGKEKEPKKKELALTAGGEAVAAPLDKGKTVAPMAKTFGPLTVRNIGLSVSGARYSKVSLSLDASVQLGPLAFALLGFTITLDLSVLTNPDKLASIITDVGINGMAVAYDRPPTRIAGMVTQFDNRGISKGFQGAISVSLDTWSAIAGGRYEELYPDFAIKSFSLFGMVQGPIAEFGAAEINGLTGGFGYNSRLQVPADASGVANFPFIALNKSGSQGGSAMDQMNLILAGGVKDAISPANEEMWFVAGLGIKAFQTFEAQAIFALTLDEHPKFTVLATATAVFPKPPKGISHSDDPFGNAFVVVDIALSCVIDPFHGTVIATGELTPVSFILNRECKLTGSFALAYFLPNSPHDGDFVFSIGGYHRDFDKPSHYPDVRNRVGISWKYDSHLSIKGESYFAITPHAVMGGGRLDMTFEKRLLGDKLWVHIAFTAYADFLMKFHPFSFQVDVTVVFQARGALDLWLYTQNLGPITLSASLSLWGPPLAGVAKLRLCTFQIEVAFGPGFCKPSPLSLDQFVRVAKNLPAEESATEKNVPNHIINVTAGKVKTGEGANTGPIEISAAGVLVQVQSRMPVLSAEISGHAEPKLSVVKNSNGEDITPRIFARPMQLQQQFKQSLLKVTLRRTNGSDTIDLDANPLIQSLPPALWGENIDKPDLASLRVPMISHVVGYTLSLRPKTGSLEGIPAISVTDFNAVDVGKDDAYSVPPIERVMYFADNESFQLACGATIQVENEEKKEEEEKKKRKATRRKKKDAFAAWDRFKSVCSGGGLAKKVQLGKIFAATQRVTA